MPKSQSLSVSNRRDLAECRPSANTKTLSAISASSKPSLSSSRNNRADNLTRSKNRFPPTAFLKLPRDNSNSNFCFLFRVLTFFLCSLTVDGQQPRSKKYLSLADGKNRVFGMPDSSGNLKDDTRNEGKKIYRQAPHANIFM